MKVPCEYCLKQVRKTPRQIKLYKHHFCNRDCYQKYKILNKEEFLHNNNTGPRLHKILNDYAKARQKLLTATKNLSLVDMQASGIDKLM